jgi:hypothetical protein
VSRGQNTAEVAKTRKTLMARFGRFKRVMIG